MITSLRFCLSYDRLNVILSPSKFISMKICIVVKDVVMRLLVPAESVMYPVVIYDMTLSTE